jgi:hypothetical protein
VQTIQPLAVEEKAQPRRATLDLLEIISETEGRQSYAKELIGAELTRDLFDQDWRLAKVFAASGVFADITGVTQEQAIATAMAKIQIGRSWGITPGDSMQFIFFTNGKPSVQNELVASKMRAAGFDWDIDWKKEAGRCVGCTLWLKRKDASGAYLPILDREGNEVSVAFSKTEADAAMIWEKGKQIPLSDKWNFKSWPQDMYFWRCIARAKRWYATDVLRGAATVDEAEETAPGEGLHRMTPPGSARAALKIAHQKIDAAIAKDPALKDVLSLEEQARIAEDERTKEVAVRFAEQASEPLNAAPAADASGQQPDQGSFELTEEQMREEERLIEERNARAAAKPAISIGRRK